MGFIIIVEMDGVDNTVFGLIERTWEEFRFSTVSITIIIIISVIIKLFYVITFGSSVHREFICVLDFWASPIGCATKPICRSNM